MLIYRLWQTEKTGYDTYDSCVVIAPTEYRAKELSIEKLCELSNNPWPKDITKINADLIGGSALPEQIVLSSYNAG